MSTFFVGNNIHADKGVATSEVVFTNAICKPIESYTDVDGLYYRQTLATYTRPDGTQGTYRIINAFQDIFETNIVEVDAIASTLWSSYLTSGRVYKLENGQKANFKFGDEDTYLSMEFEISNNVFSITTEAKKGDAVIDSSQGSWIGARTKAYITPITILDSCFGFAITYTKDASIGIAENWGNSRTATYNICNWEVLFNGFGAELPLDKKEDNPIYGTTSGTGGYTGYDGNGRKSDVIGLPPKPPSISALGFLNVYKVETNALNTFINEIFPQVDVPDIPSGGTLSEVVDSINALVDGLVNGVIQLSNGQLLKDILDCHIVPVTCTGDSSHIKVGYKTTSSIGAKVSDDYVDIDCGNLNVNEVYANYIDYVGTRAKLFLPFVGFVDLKPEYWQSGILNVYYRFNVINGSFMCWVRSKSSKSSLNMSVIGEYSGSASLSVPLNGTDYTQVLSGVASAVTSMASGNVSGTVKGMGDLISATKPQQQHNGSYNMSASFMGMKRPYLIIEREVPQFSTKYPHENGLPLNVTYKLSKLKGYTVIDKLETTSLNATEEEKEMLKELFARGVIL